MTQAVWKATVGFSHHRCWQHKSRKGIVSIQL